jgi:hypothetical protein
VLRYTCSVSLIHAIAETYDGDDNGALPVLDHLIYFQITSSKRREIGLPSRRLHSLGAAITPLPQRRLTPAHLAETIRATLGDTAVRQCTRELATRIATEDGTATAVTAIEAALHPSQSRQGSHRPE